MKSKYLKLGILGLIVFAAPTPKARAAEVSVFDDCAQILQSEEKIKEEALKSADSFHQYFKALGNKVLEREYLVKITQLALLTKEHLLLVGPPGNAKSMYANMAYGNIIDEADSSYFKTQMTFETTLSDTHGPVDFRAMETEGKVVRRYDEGILGSKLAFLDEIFDMRPNGLRSILDVLAERAHGQGSKVHKGKTWSVIAASNRYISQVYEQFGLSNQPQAVLDRMAFAAYIPPEFEQVGSYRKLIQGPKSGENTPMPELHFKDIEKMQAIVPMVTVPDHISDLLSLLVYRLRPEMEAKEDTSRRNYLEQKQSGENPLPPWRATKYMSLRTLGKAARILRGLVVLNWLESGGTRSLTANLDDLEELEIFFALNGPKDEAVQNALSRSTDPHERAQLETITREREYFRNLFRDLKEEFTQSTIAYHLQELAQGIQSFQSMLPTEKEDFLNKLKDTFIKAGSQKITGDTPQSEVTPQRIAATSIAESMKEWIEALGESKTEAHATIERWKKEFQPKEKEAQKQKEERKQEDQTKELDLVSFVVKAGVDMDPSVLSRVNPDSLKQITIEKGTYTMGSPTSEAGRADNEKQQIINISKSFKLWKYPVTQFVYWAVTKTNPSHNKLQEHAESLDEYWKSPEGIEMNLNHPVEVSVELADEFEKKWNEMFPDHKVRLPKESEWEYAARAGITTAYPNGNDDADLTQLAWFQKNSKERLHAVGKMPLNAAGLADMIGNVWEITATAYEEKPDHRVIRGGSYLDHPLQLRFAHRTSFSVSKIFKTIGFRLASD